MANAKSASLNQSKGAQQRIAILSHAHPSVSKGGAETAAYSLFTSLLSLGVDAIFIAACERKQMPRLDLGSSREHAVIFDYQHYDHFFQLSAPQIWSKVLQLLSSERIQIANFHHFLNFGINTLRKTAIETDINVVLTLHEFLAICNHHGQMVTRPAQHLCTKSSPSACGTCFPERSLQQFALRTEMFLQSLEPVDAFISPSHFLTERMKAWGLPSDRMNIVENGLPTVPSAPLINSKSADSTYVFGYFGQITPFKGVDILLRAAEYISQNTELSSRISMRIHGNLIGTSDDFASQFKAALEKHKFITHLGAYDNAQVGKLMNECDYVVVPSIWWENSPVVIQEAFAAGRPVICTGIGGMAEKVKNGISGLHFGKGDHADLARALISAMELNMFEKLTAGLPKVIDSAQMAQEYLKVFDQACNIRPGASKNSSGNHGRKN